jgi:hypothetical protein
MHFKKYSRIFHAGDGTRLEQRFTRKQIASMMLAAGLENIRFSEDFPYWCAVETRSK